MDKSFNATVGIIHARRLDCINLTACIACALNKGNIDRLNQAMLSKSMRNS